MKRKASSCCQCFFPLIYYETSIITFKFKFKSGGWFSTETSLIHTTDVFLKGIDDEKLTACVLLDLSKGALTRGSFLEGPGNVSGPKSNFQIEI